MKKNEDKIKELLEEIQKSTDEALALCDEEYGGDDEEEEESDDEEESPPKRGGKVDLAIAFMKPKKK